MEPINLRLFLSTEGQALSETWLYQYTPPRPLEVIEQEIRELESEIMKALAAVGR